MELRNNELFICDCASQEHQIIFRTDLFDEDDSGNPKLVGVFVSIHLQGGSFWQRLKRGIAYIFGHKSHFGEWDEFIFEKDDIDRLGKVLDHYNKLMK